jgi:hypothetical protein
MKKIILNEADKKVIISQKEKAIIENFTKTFNSIKRIDEMDYEREITIDDFRWLSKFPGWYPVKLDNGVFAIKNDDYPIISYEVSIADYNNGGHQTYGKPTNQEYPWKFIAKKAVNPDSFINKNFAPEGFTVIEGGQTSNLESTFAHFLKHQLRHFKKGEKLNEELPAVDAPVQPTKISREDMEVLDNVYNQLAQLAESPTVTQNPQAHSVILRAAQNLRQLTF